LILVTGADGFIGREVCNQIERAGLEYAGTDLPCDLGDAEEVTELFRQRAFDTVIHLAAMLPSACRADPAAATRVNIVGTMNVLEAAADSRVKRFVFGSSMSAYGSDLYGAGKRYGEIYGDTVARGGAFSFVALRIATVVGPGARRTGSPWRSEIFEKLGAALCASNQRVSIPLSGDLVLSLVYVEDVARMLLLLATRLPPPSGIYESPSEDWRVGDLKSAVEALDRNVIVELEASGPGAALPLADGTAFIRDFGWQSQSLMDRLTACKAARFAPK
jgi:nucleoside-diphosphate-sugar epimerase